jgi:hypothetical protein
MNMSESKHTPGPFFQNPGHPTIWTEANKDAGNHVCHTACDGQRPTTEDLANARRIAALLNAADELGLSTEAIEGGAIKGLLASLIEYVEFEEQAAPCSSSPMREKARAAIAKAVGEV